jgi:hypothetical protein
MKSTRRELRDLILIVLILPIGILCMLAVGQFAIRMLPSWNIAADMGSNVDPNKQYASFQEIRVVEPLLSAIQTPPAWRDTFLTPQAGKGSSGVVPLATFDPSVTPSPEATVNETATQVATASPSATASSTSVPTNTASPTSVTTVTATASGTQPTATAVKTKKPGDDDDDPPPTNPPPTNPVTSVPPTATASPIPSTPDPALTVLSTPPSGFNAGAPDTSSASGPNFPDGSYFVVTLNTPVHVSASPDGNYDMVYYEVENPAGSGNIAIDRVIVGISQNSNGNPYYEVFNWGDGKPDTNTNVDTTKIVVPTAEVDNQNIPTTDLHKDPAASPQTGILIDVDNAPSHPPEGDYSYAVVIAPPADPPPAPPGDGGQVDAVQVTEVPIP